MISILADQNLRTMPIELTEEDSDQSFEDFWEEYETKSQQEKIDSLKPAHKALKDLK